MSLYRFTVLAFITFSAFTLGLVGWAFSPITLESAEIEVVIKSQSSTLSIAHQLEENGVAVQPELFFLWAKWLQFRSKRQPQAGTYALHNGITPHQIIEKMIRAEVVRVSIAIIEGWDFKKMREVIDRNPRLTHNTLGMTTTQLLQTIGIEQTHPEGLFFPDTYIVNAGSSDIDVFKKSYQAMQKHLDTAWQLRAPGLPYRNPYEALIIASIIEKETGQTRDRNKIAAVFINRMRLGMRLQTDPTLIYGMGADFDGNLRKKDLLTDTPYNTYTRAGLPPTPISLPSKESLLAAVNPANTNALYFVARGDGGSVFSSNLLDHSRAVTRFQKTPLTKP